MATLTDHTIQKDNVSGRFRSLDGLRGLCALFVALFHFHVLGPIYDFPIVRHAYLFVDLFFVLSGFVVTHAYGQNTNGRPLALAYLLRRFARLWPLHIVTLGAVFLLWVIRIFLFDPQPADPNWVKSLINHVLLLNSVGLDSGLTWNIPSWSIGAEFYVSVLFLLLTASLSPRRVTIVLCVVGMAALAALLVLSPQTIDVSYDYGTLRCAYSFALGNVVYWLHRALSAYQPRQSVLSLAQLLVTLILIAVLWVKVSGYASYAIPLAFALAILIFAREDGLISVWLRSEWLNFLGTVSYGIYLVHFPLVLCFEAVFNILERRGMALTIRTADGFAAASPVWSVAITIVYVSAVIVTARLGYRLIELPCNDLGRRAAGRMLKAGFAEIRPEGKGS